MNKNILIKVAALEQTFSEKHPHQRIDRI